MIDFHKYTITINLSDGVTINNQSAFEFDDAEDVKVSGRLIEFYYEGKSHQLIIPSNALIDVVKKPKSKMDEYYEDMFSSYPDSPMLTYRG